MATNRHEAPQMIPDMGHAIGDHDCPMIALQLAVHSPQILAHALQLAGLHLHVRELGMLLVIGNTHKGTIARAI